MAEDLRRFLAGETLLARRASPLERLTRWCQRNPVVAVLALGFILALVGGSAASLMFAVRARAEARRAIAAGQAAVAAQLKAEAEGLRAERERERAESSLYHSRVGQAERALEAHDIVAARQLLAKCVPGPGQRDRRGWEWRYLQGLCHAELLVLADHRFPFLSRAAFSPDGRLLASASWEVGGKGGEVIVRDAYTGATVRTLNLSMKEGIINFDALMSVRFSADGRRLVVASPPYPRVKRLLVGWETDSWREADPGSISPPPERVDEPAVGDLRVELRQGRALLVDRQTGAERFRLVGHVGDILDASLGPDGLSVATCGNDQTVRLWHAASGTLIDVFHGHTNSVRSVAFSPDGTKLASTGVDQTIRIWDLTRLTRELVTGKTWKLSPEDHSGGEYFGPFAFGPRGDTIEQVCFLDPPFYGVPRISKIDAEAGILISRTPLAMSIPEGRRTSWEFSSDLRWLAVPLAREPGGVLLIETDSGQQVGRLGTDRGPMSLAAFQPDGQRLAGTSVRDDSITLWDISKGTEIWTVDRAEIDASLVADRLEAQLGRIGKVYGAATAHAILAIRYLGDPALRPMFRGRATDHAHKALAAKPREPFFRTIFGVALLAENRWREAIEAVGTPEGADDPLGCLVLAVGLGRLGDRTGARVWLDRADRAKEDPNLLDDFRRASRRLRREAMAALSGQALTVEEAESAETSGCRLPPVRSMAFSADGSTIATGLSYGPGVLLWNAADGSMRKALLTDADSPIICVAFRPDGKALAVVDALSGTVRVVDLADGKEVFAVPGPTSVEWAAFSPDGRRLAAAGRRGHIHTWDAQDGQDSLILRRSIQQGPGNYGFRARVAFSPDGSRLAANAWTGEIEVWDAPGTSPRGRAARDRAAEARAFAWHVGQAATHRDRPSAVRFHLDQVRGRQAPGLATLFVQADLERCAGSVDDARATLTRSIEGHPEQAQPLIHRADFLARLGQWDRVAADLTLAVARATEDLTTMRVLAAAGCLRAGDPKRFRSLLEALLNRSDEYEDKTARDVALACLISADGPHGDPRAQRLIHRAGDESISALADVRAGRASASIERVRAEQKRVSADDVVSQTRLMLVLGLCSARAKHPDLEEAGRCLERAVVLLRKLEESRYSGPLGLWPSLSCEILRGELDGLIRDSSFPADPFG
jgi:WD40 repeat protein